MSPLTTREADLHYERGGCAGRPPIVFLHGLGSSPADWAGQAAAFGERFRVVAIDLRAHGRSLRPPGRLSVEAMAADVVSLLARLGEGPAHVVGRLLDTRRERVLSHATCRLPPSSKRRISRARTAA